MSVLWRDELIALFKTDELKIEDTDNTFHGWANLPYSWDNPFQSCSIDLHVGEIFVPETEPPNSPGGAYNPKTDEHVLVSGHTVMIRTKEKITLPAYVGGICFSPSRLALKAILITNTGHVDPGYAGHLHFTAINMGREPYTFRRNDIICSMVFFKLPQKVPAFGEEHFINNKDGTKIPAVIANYFPKLSRDFVNVEKRAESISRNRIRKAMIYQVGAPIIGAILIAAVSIITLWLSKPWEKSFVEVNSKIESIEKRLNYEERIKILEGTVFAPQKRGATSK